MVNNLPFLSELEYTILYESVRHTERCPVPVAPGEGASIDTLVCFSTNPDFLYTDKLSIKIKKGFCLL